MLQVVLVGAARKTQMGCGFPANKKTMSLCKWPDQNQRVDIEIFILK
jgi:hypothetical protein